MKKRLVVGICALADVVYDNKDIGTAIAGA